VSAPFSQVPHALVLADGVTLSALRCYHVIYVETLGRPTWDLSYRQIAEKAGIGERSAFTGVQWLIDNGWLLVESTDGRPNLYLVCREPGVRWNQQGPLQSTAKVTPEPLQSTAKVGAEPLQPTAKVPSLSTARHQENHHQEKEQPPVAPPAAARNGHRHGATIPEDLTPDPDLVAWTRTHAPLIDAALECEQFRDYHLAKGTRYRDWRRAWMTWARRSQQTASERRPGPRTGGRPRTYEERLR